MEASDEELMARYVAGDAQAFRELFERYAPRLERLLRRCTFRQEDALDLVQQTFLQLHRARHDFRADSRLRPWLYTIALNLQRKHFRTRGRRPEQVLDEEPEGRAEAPEGGLQREERSQRLHRALEELPGSQREVIQLHWFEGLPFAEVASIVGASLSAVKVRAHRGYRRLAELLGNLAPGAE